MLVAANERRSMERVGRLVQIAAGGANSSPEIANYPLLPLSPRLTVESCNFRNLEAETPVQWHDFLDCSSLYSRVIDIPEIQDWKEHNIELGDQLPSCEYFYFFF